MIETRYSSVWDAIADTPAQAENLRLRAELMTRLREYIAEKQLSQSEAAKVLRVTQPRVSDLNRGKIALFSLDTLVKMAADAGFQVGLTISRAA